MKRISIYLLNTLAMLFISMAVNAQTIALKNAPANVKIDGNAEEWKGYEESVNDKSKISYIIANDKDNLYLVIKTKDKKKQQNILGAGVTFSIDTKGKKKETFSTTFPNPDMDDLSEFEHLDNANFKMRVAATEFMKIRAIGFSTLPQFLGSRKNDQNINAAISYTADGELILEEVIPLKLFNAAADEASEWAFNIKVNGLFQRAGMTDPNTGAVASPAAGGGGSSGRSRRVSPAGAASMPAMARDYQVNQLTSSSDFWGKFTLAK